MVARVSAVVLLLTSLVASQSDGLAAVRRVPSEYPTIVAAVGASVQGDTVLVAPGIYSGAGNTHITFGQRGLALMSEAGAEVTVLDGGGVRRPIYMGYEPPSAEIRGFTITGGLEGIGGGLQLDDYGGTITDCVIEGNYSTNSGGAVYCSGRAQFVRCRIAGNASGGAGGGVAVATHGARYVQFTDCSFEENASMGNGGGAYINGPARFIQCKFAANEGESGGAVFVDYDQADVSMSHCLITGNVAYEDGGGIGLTSSTRLLLSNCTIAGNMAVRRGGGFFSYYRPWVSFQASIVDGNCAGNGDEGYLFDPFSKAEFDCCLVDTTAVRGVGTVVCVGPVFDQDPAFLYPIECSEAPTVAGDYHLGSGSPCMPGGNACGALLGALLPEGGLAEVEDSEIALRAVTVFPNPSAGPVMILASQQTPASRALSIVEASGRLVKDLGTVEKMPTSYQLSWDGTDKNGHEVPAGVYFVRMTGVGPKSTQRFVVLKR